MYQFDIVGESWFCHPSPPYEIGLFLKVATFYRLCQLCFMHNPHIIGMVQFLSNQSFLWLMSDCDYGFVVPADVMYGEVVPYGKKFSECISRATQKIIKPINR